MMFKKEQRWIFENNRDKVLFEVMQDEAQDTSVILKALQIYRGGNAYMLQTAYYSNIAIMKVTWNGWYHLEGQDKPT